MLGPCNPDDSKVHCSTCIVSHRACYTGLRAMAPVTIQYVIEWSNDPVLRGSFPGVAVEECVVLPQKVILSRSEL